MKTKQGFEIDERKLRVALAERGWPQWRLAARVGVSPSSFSAFRRGRRSPTAALVRRIERVLQVADGMLVSAAPAHNAT